MTESVGGHDGDHGPIVDVHDERADLDDRTSLEPAVEQPVQTPVALAVSDLTYRYPGGDRPVLEGLSLQVAHGERVAVLGANGSGKTTLALHLNGLLTCQSGRITVLGHRLGPDTLRAVRREVGLVFQDPDDQLFMGTVRDDVAFGPANQGLRGDELAEVTRQALGRVGAAHLADRAPHQLSQGEQRRVAIATVLAMDPGLLVLDEPTAGLDPVGTHDLATLLTGLAATQIVVTHDLPFALATCTRAVILAGGRVVADGRPAAVIGDADTLARHGLALPYGYPAPT